MFTKKMKITMCYNEVVRKKNIFENSENYQKSYWSIELIFENIQHEEIHNLGCIKSLF